jgi:hypothetical protein
VRHVFHLKEVHVARDADEDVLSDVDLHQNEELVEGSEDVADGAQVNPFDSVYAKQVLVRIRVGLSINYEVPRCDCEDGYYSEDKVGNEEALRLLLEKHFVVSQFVA